MNVPEKEQFTVFHKGLDDKGKNAVKQVWFDQITFTELPNTTVLIFCLTKVKWNMETSISNKSIWEEQGF